MRRLAWFLLAGLALGQQAGYQVSPRYSRKLPIEDVLSRVDARQDDWVGERDYEEMHERLEAVARALREGKPGGEALDRHARRFARLDVVQLKIISSSRANEADSTARLGLRLEFAGVVRGGEKLSLQGTWESVWRRVDGRWEMDRLGSTPLREVPNGFSFTEVTDRALGGNDSFRLQLSKGNEHWRGLLDEATGMDVYGHNGLAVGDYDGDGLEDLYVCQPSGLPNRLYRNNGDGTFTDTTVAAGLDILDDTRSALFADLDNDGHADLIVITASQPLVFRNDGHGRYSLDKTSGLDIPAGEAASLTSAALADYDNDGWLDIYICAYDFWRPGKTYNAPTPYYDATNGPPNFLFRNVNGKRFENVTRRAGLMRNNDRYSFAAAWGDYDGDGHADLYVANDFGRNNLYRNNGDGTFRDVSAEAGVEDLGAGMSAAWGDADGDGGLDLYVGNMWSSAGQRVTGNRQFEGIAKSAGVRGAFQRQAKGNSLFLNDGDGKFRDTSETSGVEMGRWAWSSDFVDLDNDGALDLLVLNGYITGASQQDL